MGIFGLGAQAQRNIDHGADDALQLVVLIDRPHPIFGWKGFAITANEKLSFRVTVEAGARRRQNGIVDGREQRPIGAGVLHDIQQRFANNMAFIACANQCHKGGVADGDRPAAIDTENAFGGRIDEQAENNSCERSRF